MYTRTARSVEWYEEEARKLAATQHFRGVAVPRGGLLSSATCAKFYGGLVTIEQYGELLCACRYVETYRNMLCGDAGKYVTCPTDKLTLM